MDDAEAVYHCYASDENVTKYLGWPKHKSVEDTRDFISVSDQIWDQHGVGPYLVADSLDNSLLGCTGLDFETEYRAATGYAFASSAWGKGYATEALQAMVSIATDLSFHRVYAMCHPEHAASARVLEKCGFEFEGKLLAHTEFPNLSPGVASDVLSYGIRVG